MTASLAAWRLLLPNPRAIRIEHVSTEPAAGVPPRRLQWQRKVVTYDGQGHPRYFSFSPEAAPAGAAAAAGVSGAPTAQEAARNFLRAQASALQIPQEAVQGLDLRAAITPTVEEQALRFESEKHLMDSTVVSYTQTMFGLPIYQAGVSVTMHVAGQQVKAATSTLHYDIAAQPPGDTLTGAADERGGRRRLRRPGPQRASGRPRDADQSHPVDGLPLRCRRRARTPMRRGTVRAAFTRNPRPCRCRRCRHRSSTASTMWPWRRCLHCRWKGIPRSTGGPSSSRRRDRCSTCGR